MAVEGIIANGVTEILKKLSSVVSNEITLVWDFNDELKNLQSTLNMIMAVMEDAENKQLSKAAVRLWMEELKAIAYDAEDILDEYSYEVIQCKHKKVRNIFSSSKPSFLVSWKLAHKVKKINEKLNKIAKRKNDLGLQTIDLGSSLSSADMIMMMNRETYSSIVEDWKFVGRKNDKSTIIKMLLEEEDNSSNNQGGGGCKHVSVISIVGMGGLGKTTMAQQVYNDEAVQKHFELKIWICVSDPFDIKKLYKNIAHSIEKAKQYDDASATTMDDMVHLLQDAFRGKKFLLVLDDVWNENRGDWNKFKTPFMVGREGSKILVTTRNEKVALIMVDKFQPYPLGILNENDCWSLFKEIAFGSAAGVEETPDLVEIGKEMVNRCKGLPLAVIFLGSLMRSKKKEEEWKIVRDTKLWHESREGKNSEILPSLRLSYDYLPSHLKLCFSYCCLFPKDWKIQREKLIRLWMAEGFLTESLEENTMSMEEIGNEYFHNLLSNFFFHDVKRNKDGDVLSCKMHDLVHDLARSIVGNNECLIVESAGDVELISEATRRLNLLVNLSDEGMLPKVLEALKKAKKLRTVFINNQTIVFDIGNALKENKRLRVLDLSCCDFRTESPSSVGWLKHLRYLDVHVLRYVGLFGSRRFSFPKGIGRFSFLQTLNGFNIDDKKVKGNACGIEELEGLNLLRGDFSIYSLENVKSGTAACRANLKEKRNLRGLRLNWDGEHWEWGYHNEAAVLEELRPHPNLKTLWIEEFKGAKLPSWIEHSSCLPNLVELTLFDCSYEQVTGIGVLPSLRILKLKRLFKVKCIGNELYYSSAAAAAAGGGGGTTTIAFPSLKKLILDDMHSLKEWVIPPQTSTTGATNCCFPLLEEINICDCPVLSTITSTIFPSLKVLELNDIDGSAAAIETLVTNNLNSLISLRLRNICNLISLPRQGLMENNNTLRSLEIGYCPKFKGFLPTPNNYDDDDQQQVSSSTSSSSLQSLRLYECPALRLYPNIRSLTSLRALEIQECKGSKSLKHELTRLSSSPTLEHLEHVKILKKNTATFQQEVFFEWRKP